jgi:hypothetical protein
MMQTDYPYISKGIGQSNQKDMDYIKIQRRITNLWALVGNTPYVGITLYIPGATS